MRAEEEDRGGTPEYSKWRFSPPESKEWLQFDRDTFCRTMLKIAHEPGHARMLFVGDSMSMHMMQALARSVRVEHLSGMKPGGARPSFMREEDYAPQLVHGIHKNNAALACDGQLYIQQQGTMSLVTDYTGEIVFREHLEWLRSFDVVVIMLPWGVDLNAALFWAESLLPRQRLLFRTPTIGHEQTGAQYNHSWNPTDVHPMLQNRPHKAPLRSPQEVVSYYKTIRGHKSWLRLRKQQEKAIADMEELGLAVADFFYLAAMTWDRHRDPLHFCVPGPIDRWNDVVFNWLVRGHIRDFRAWAAAFSREVTLLGGLMNSENMSLARDHDLSSGDSNPMIETE